MPTDKKFTGQRLDATGLYYYGARYYDATIGRFLSADTLAPKSGNPQSFNKYSYCINNPLSCIDPAGKDYLFICGSGGKPEDWYPMIEALNIDRNKEQVYIMYENPEGNTFGFPFEIQDQVQGITDFLATTPLTDIKLIGHSEGAAAIITVLDKIANDDTFLADTNIRSELQAAITIEAPTIGLGLEADNFVLGWDQDRYDNLPLELYGKGIGVELLDIWNEVSLVHSTCPMPGWSDYSWSYSSATWWNPWTWDFWNAHSNPLENQEVFDRIQEIID